MNLLLPNAVQVDSDTQEKISMLQERLALIPSSIFRAYDIRGVVDQTLTEEGVYLIGKAIGSLVRERGESQIVIARDGRFSGPRLSHALSEGLLASGCDVLDIGMVPTPLLYFATHVLSQRSGVMLTGSHNPSDYNGLKMVIGGATLSESDIQDLYHRIAEQRFTEGRGKRMEMDNIVELYTQEVLGRVKLAKPLRIVIDAGNGVAGKIAPALYRALGCEVHELFCEVDGAFPNHHPDPSQAENLQDLVRAVKEQNADLGLAFDGDGDRLGMVTRSGEIIGSDRVLMLFAKSILAERPRAKIIFDVKCTNELAKVITTFNGEPIMWKTGHSLIKSKMAETKAALAGEMSGHFFFEDRWYGFDDGLYAGARLLEIVSSHSGSSDSLFADLPDSVNTPELKIHVADEEKFKLMQQLISQAHFPGAEDILTIDGLRVSFADGWGLVRPSNTTPYLIMRFEALNETVLAEIKTIFKNWMLSVRPELELPF